MAEVYPGSSFAARSRTGETLLAIDRAREVLGYEPAVYQLSPLPYPYHPPTLASDPQAGTQARSGRRGLRR